MIEGVAFGQHVPSAPSDDRPYRIFKGFMGPADEVALEIRAVASDDAVRAVLAQINYDGLNGLLATPGPHIGAHATPVPLAQQAQIAEAILHGQGDVSDELYEAAQNDLASDRTPGMGALGDVIDQLLGNPGLKSQGDAAETAKVGVQPSSGTKSAAEPKRIQTGSSVVAVCTTDGAFKRCRIEGG